MVLGGFIKQSLIDFPGHISAVVFTQSCNLRCPYCHNAALVIPELYQEQIYLDEVFSYLERNKLLLDAVVVSGGEPCLQNDLGSFLHKIKRLGLKIKLDTNGTLPSVLEQLIENKLIDFIAMDIKTELRFDAYNQITGNKLSPAIFENINKSIGLIKQCGLPYEFRTTVVDSFHNDALIEKIENQLQITEMGSFKTNAFLASDKLVGEF